MSDMPERIWAWFFMENLREDVISGGWTEEPDRREQEYIRADLALTAPKVKALVWEDWSARHRTNFTAITGFGRYGIMQMHFPEMHFKIETPYKKTLYAATIEAAKAAAQADYEARILAALEGGDA